LPACCTASACAAMPVAAVFAVALDCACFCSCWARPTDTNTLETLTTRSPCFGCERSKACARAYGGAGLRLSAAASPGNLCRAARVAGKTAPGGRMSVGSLSNLTRRGGVRKNRAPKADGPRETERPTARLPTPRNRHPVAVSEPAQISGHEAAPAYHSFSRRTRPPCRPSAIDAMRRSGAD